MRETAECTAVPAPALLVGFLLALGSILVVVRNLHATLFKGSTGPWQIVTFSIEIRSPGQRCRQAVAEADAAAKRILSSPLTG